MKYTTCVRREAGYCGIQWSQTSFTSASTTVTPDPFELDDTGATALAVSSKILKLTVFENHRKSLIQHCERSELRIHFEWTKVN